MKYRGSVEELPNGRWRAKVQWDWGYMMQDFGAEHHAKAWQTVISFCKRQSEEYELIHGGRGQ